MGQSVKDKQSGSNFSGGLFISNPWAKIRDMEKRAEGCGPGEELGKEEAEEGRGLFIRPLEAV